MRHVRFIIAMLSVLLTATLVSAQQADSVTPTVTDAAPYDIVYLIADDAETDPRISPQALHEQFGADSIHRWQDLTVYHDIVGIEALLIHPSALEMIEREWLQAAYGRGMVVTAFNLPATELATLLDKEAFADDYTLVADDVVFVTRHAFHTPAYFPDTTPSVTRRSSGGGRVNQLSTAEGRMALTLFVQDIEYIQEQKYRLIDDLLDND